MEGEANGDGDESDELPTGWVLIRRERLHLRSATTVRREMGIDFKYPFSNLAVGQMVDEMETPLVPLTLYTKGERLAGFTVLDMEGRHVLVRSRGEGQAYGADCLWALAKTTLREELAREVGQAFSQVATLPRPHAEDLLARMRVLAETEAPNHAAAKRAFGGGWRDFVTSESPDPAVAQIVAGLAEYCPQLWRVLEQPPINELARTFARQFMLLAPIPRDQLTSGCTLGFDEDYRRPAGQSTVRRVGATVCEALGWKACQYEIEVPAIGRAERYQAEIPAPSGLQIVSAEMRCWPPRGERAEPMESEDQAGRDLAPVPRAMRAGWRALLASDAPPGSVAYRAPVTRALAAAMGSLRRPRQSSAATPLRRVVPMSDSAVALQFEDHDIPEGSSGLVLVGFQASRTGLVLLAPFLSAIITVVLFVGRGRLHAVSHYSSYETAGPLLLALPSLLAAFIARPIDHDLTARLLTGTRVLVAIAGLTTFVAAASLAGRWPYGSLHVIWGCAAWTAAGVTVLLLFALTLGVQRSWRAGHAKVQELGAFPDA
jgi:hypothetical protein